MNFQTSPTDMANLQFLADHLGATRSAIIRIALKEWLDKNMPNAQTKSANEG